MRIAWALLLSIIVIEVAWGDEVNDEDDYIFQADQLIQGNGFFNSYKDIHSGYLAMNSKGYGTGSYNYESMTKVQKDARYRSKTDDYSTLNEQKIKYDETVDFSGSPMNFGLGKTFSAVDLNKLGKEETWVKNYGDAVSMNSLFDSASVLSKNLSADLLWHGAAFDQAGEKWNKEWGHTNLTLDAAFTGKGHIGVLQQQYSDQGKARNQSVDYEIDEDYLGSYHITKKMSQTFNKTDAYYNHDWLGCCWGGFESMNPIDSRAFKSAKGIFDCTCFQPPIRAEFA